MYKASADSAEKMASVLIISKIWAGKIVKIGFFCQISMFVLIQQSNKKTKKFHEKNCQISKVLFPVKSQH